MPEMKLFERKNGWREGVARGDARREKKRSQMGRSKEKVLHIFDIQSTLQTLTKKKPINLSLTDEMQFILQSKRINSI